MTSLSEYPRVFLFPFKTYQNLVIVSQIQQKQLYLKFLQKNIDVVESESNQKQMLLEYPSVQFQSINELKKYASHHFLQKLPKKSFSSKQISTELRRAKSLSKQFIPFCQERDLGRLLSNKKFTNQKQQQQTPVQKLLQMVTFRNFKKLYRMEKKTQEAKYASKIRVSGQKNLINREEWILNDVRQKHNNQLKNDHKGSCQTSRFGQSQSNVNKQGRNSYSHLRPCCKSTHLQNQIHLKGQNRSISKMDLQLYKKLSTNRPPSSNDPDLITLYDHYIKSCQLNENQRRRILTQTKK